MKKNAMLKVAAVVLVAVLLTTCAISSTFAKYTTGEKTLGAASARVAKWGVAVKSDILTESNGLFDVEYTTGTSQEGKGNVISSDSTNVVAPGTSGSVTVANVATGTPEVSGKITVTAKVTFGGNWEVEDEVYCPLVFKVNNGEAITCTGTLADFATAIQNAVAAKGTSYFEANQAVTMDDSLTLSWDWAFTGANDAKDTALGDLAATSNLTVQIQLFTTVEQTGAAGPATA